MAGFEDCARRITEGLELPKAVKEEIRQEALAHLEDEAERLVAGGKTREEAESAALEAFGRADVIGGLVDEALGRMQRRFRMGRFIRQWAIYAALVAVVFGMGIAVAPLSDYLNGLMLSNRSDGTVIPVMAASLLAIIAVVLVAATGLSGARWWVTAICAIAVFGLYFFSTVLLRTTGLAGAAVFAAKRLSPTALLFAFGLFFGWVPALFAGVGVIFIKRDRRGAILMMAVFAIAILEASLWALGAAQPRQVLYYGQELPTNWAWVAARGVTAVVFVMITWLLARVATLRWGRKTHSGGEAQAQVVA
jgi:hypothetical protein